MVTGLSIVSNWVKGRSKLLHLPATHTRKALPKEMLMRLLQDKRFSAGIISKEQWMRRLKKMTLELRCC